MMRTLNVVETTLDLIRFQNFILQSERKKNVYNNDAKIEHTIPYLQSPMTLTTCSTLNLN